MQGLSTSWMFEPLRPLSFDLIAADPPWDVETYSELGDKKGARNHYDTMPTEAIKSLPVGHLARGDALLMLWVVSPLLPEGLEVMEAWGFKYKSHMGWIKVTKNQKRRWGPGYRVRTLHETILLGTMGNPQHKPFPSVFDGLAREHSRKPEEFYALVNKYAPKLTKLDLFSRQSRPGWSNWGRESTLFDQPGGKPTRPIRPVAELAPIDPLGLFPEAAVQLRPAAAE